MLELSSPGAKVPPLPGTKVPGNEIDLSFPGTFASWNFRSLPRTVALRVNFFDTVGLTIVNINVRYRSLLLIRACIKCEVRKCESVKSVNV